MNIAEDLPDVDFTSYTKDCKYSIDNNITFNEISSKEEKKVYKVDISA